MKINQAYVSKSVHDFPFLESYYLTGYIDSSRPCVFFGCYRREDIDAVLNHRSIAVIWWCGQDALDIKDWKIFNKPNIFHVTERKNVKQYMDWQLVNCELLPCSDMGLKGKPMKLGNKIFAYAPKSYPEYHRIDIINNLKEKGYDILIGDGSCRQSEWRAGKCDEYYSQCFIGLVLSPFAGGGATVIELGLRGIPCVTNVVDLPNVIHYKTEEGVERAINLNNINVGGKYIELAKTVSNAIDYEHKFLNIERYEY